MDISIGESSENEDDVLDTNSVEEIDVADQDLLEIEPSSTEQEKEQLESDEAELNAIMSEADTAEVKGVEEIEDPLADALDETWRELAVDSLNTSEAAREEFDVVPDETSDVFLSVTSDAPNDSLGEVNPDFLDDIDLPFEEVNDAEAEIPIEILVRPEAAAMSHGEHETNEESDLQNPAENVDYDISGISPFEIDPTDNQDQTTDLDTPNYDNDVPGDDDTPKRSNSRGIDNTSADANTSVNDLHCAPTDNHEWSDNVVLTTVQEQPESTAVTASDTLIPEEFERLSEPALESSDINRVADNTDAMANDLANDPESPFTKDFEREAEASAARLNEEETEYWSLVDQQDRNDMADTNEEPFDSAETRSSNLPRSELNEDQELPISHPESIEQASTLIDTVDTPFPFVRDVLDAEKSYMESVFGSVDEMTPEELEFVQKTIDSANNAIKELTTIPELKPETWEHLSMDKKTATLNRVEGIMAKHQLRNPEIVKLELMDMNEYGYWDKEKIAVNSEHVRYLMPVEENLDTVVHEGRHVCQDILKGPDGEMPDRFKDMFNQNYKPPSLFGREEYEKQPVERDTFLYAAMIRRGVYG